jgi:hypothetical protein
MKLAFKQLISSTLVLAIPLTILAPLRVQADEDQNMRNAMTLDYGSADTNAAVAAVHGLDKWTDEDFAPAYFLALFNLHEYDLLIQGLRNGRFIQDELAKENIDIGGPLVILPAEMALTVGALAMVARASNPAATSQQLKVNLEAKVKAYSGKFPELKAAHRAFNEALAEVKKNAKKLKTAGDERLEQFNSAASKLNSAKKRLAIAEEQAMIQISERAANFNPSALKTVLRRATRGSRYTFVGIAILGLQYLARDEYFLAYKADGDYDAAIQALNYARANQQLLITELEDRENAKIYGSSQN